jgi:hypothetical protein
MRQTARQTRDTRTITVAFHDETPDCQLLDDRKAFVECVLACRLPLGLQLTHQAPCGGGWCLTRHAHAVRVRLGGLTIWPIPCTRCQAVCPVLPHFVLRDRQRRPAVARDAWLATHGGLSGAWGAVLYPISPMAL